MYCERTWLRPGNLEINIAMEQIYLEQKTKRRFASMEPERRRLIASKGGKIAHEQGLAHEWDKEEAKKAGRKGGSVSSLHRRLNRTENDGRDDIL